MYYRDNINYNNKRYNSHNFRRLSLAECLIISRFIIDSIYKGRKVKIRSYQRTLTTSNGSLLFTSDEISSNDSIWFDMATIYEYIHSEMSKYNGYTIVCELGHMIEFYTGHITISDENQKLFIIRGDAAYTFDVSNVSTGGNHFVCDTIDDIVDCLHDIFSERIN